MCMMHDTKKEIEAVVSDALAALPPGALPAVAEAAVLAALEAAYPECVAEGPDGCIARQARAAAQAWWERQQGQAAAWVQARLQEVVGSLGRVTQH